MYENGIDIFRMKTETVGDFAFDHCDLDLVAFALQSKGIRERCKARSSIRML